MAFERLAMRSVADQRQPGVGKRLKKGPQALEILLG
jgi:hypothetical protein